MRRELSIMIWVLLDPPSHKVWCAQQQSIFKWKWYMQDQARAGPEGTIKLHEEAAQMPSFHSRYNAANCQACSYSLMEGSLWLADWERNDLVMVLHARQASLRSGQLQHYNPFLGQPCKALPKGHLHSGQNFRQSTESYSLSGRRGSQMHVCSLSHSLLAMDWLDGQGLRA